VPIYARSDVSHVAISTVHGGCGSSHSRPVHNGAPVHVWELRCLQCEDYLRSDPLWAPMPGQVPETPDEQNARESSEKRTQLDVERSNAEAFSQLANSVSGNATAMQKLVELMAILVPVPIAAPQTATVPGEVLSRAREVEATMPSATPVPDENQIITQPSQSEESETEPAEEAGKPKPDKTDGVATPRRRGRPPKSSHMAASRN
jgi:hypothetical protein